jgi:TOTE conflict system, Archaeo-Eukaryotic Primase domain
VRCGECPNHAFLPVEDQVILDHLQGRHVVGVYPLLTDETCWFRAADFDKTSWADDVAAFVETCRLAGLPAAVERSRSGNGAHVWFFFSAPVVASTAARWAVISSPKHPVPLRRVESLGERVRVHRAGHPRSPRVAPRDGITRGRVAEERSTDDGDD